MNFLDIESGEKIDAKSRIKKVLALILILAVTTTVIFMSFFAARTYISSVYRGQIEGRSLTDDEENFFQKYYVGMKCRKLIQSEMVNIIHVSLNLVFKEKK